MPFKIITGDFLEQEAEIMVIPTSKRSAHPYTAVSERVYQVAGYSKMYDARENFGELSPGDIVVTPGFDLNVQHVIHVCIPTVHVNNDLKASIYALKKCYRKALEYAEEKEAKSISFPFMGKGFYPEAAKSIASDTIRNYLRSRESCMTVYFVIPPSYEPVYEDQTKSESPVTENYIDCYTEYDIRFEEDFRNSGLSRDTFCREYVDKLLTDRITNAEQLANAIDYDKGNLCKFRNGQTLKPKKHRVIAMAIGMGLSDEERYNFIRSVGYNKYPEDERDRIVEKLMRSERRDFESVNNELCRINPDFALNAKSRKDKKNEKSKEKE